MSAVGAQICEACWAIEAGGHDLKPHRLDVTDRVTEPCFDCHRPTNSGIYVRREYIDLGRPSIMPHSACFFPHVRMPVLTTRSGERALHNQACSASGWPCPIHCETWKTP